MEYDTDTPQIPNHTLSEHQFLLGTNISKNERARLFKEMTAIIEADSMAPYYKYLHEEVDDFPFDEALYTKFAQKNEENATLLKLRIKEAEGEDETEWDILSATLRLAEHYTTIVDHKNAVETYKKALELPQSTGSKIDILLTLTRIEFFFNDYQLVSKYLEQTKALIEKGGDWERRNRYKTYHGIYLMATRNFAEASKLLTDSLATFTSTELCSYEQVAYYAIVCGVLTLGRVDLRLKIIESPEILSIYSSAPSLEPLLNLTNSLYTCEYNCFFQYLLESYDALLLPNKYLHQHANYFLREMRCKAYGQLLESYKSLSLKSMAHNFNISEEFLDQDLCKFIPNKKLNCTIDKVNGIIETNRPDNKNSQYHLLIKQGDNLLTKLQKYGAAVKLSGAERVA
ncbi:PCI-domain-containing protein [Suhomyces tanzawaensis NRRL Y-17324]|uniref:PCI-domain-containing protein n=1 Tax=Suhomyces tanzawaensis NRRL Y-17324 TaxID=984487 RepID=A0A1E4SG19_9ASCO|nr:PCI-domain-containing protein [Suhomyces tanzawaensis NRRL Y-17324]ODV78352.1 PCI-domain-containing protein [Suhomyces tanzawaensis NRRL Y-17324]